VPSQDQVGGGAVPSAHLVDAELRSTLWYGSWLANVGQGMDLRGVPHPLRDEGGEWLAGRAPLAPLPPPLSYVRLFQVAPSLEEVVRPLRDDMWLATTVIEQDLPGPRTRDSVLLVRCVEQGLLARVSKHKLTMVNPLFAIPKKDGTLRVILDARRVNAVIPDVPTLELAAWSAVRNRMAWAEVFGMLDAVAFFHQFEMESAALRALCGVRGTVGMAQYTRASQGLKILPSICHRVTETLVALSGCCALPWIDNVLFTDENKRSSRQSFDKLMKLFSSVGITMSTDVGKSFHGARQGEALGAFWDLDNRTLRPTSGFVERVSTLLGEAFSRDQGGRPSTALELFVLLGSQVWWCTVGEVPLCTVPLVGAYMSFVGAQARSHGWDTKVPLWGSVRHMWTQWSSSLHVGFSFPLVRNVVPRGPPLHVSTDASLTGGGSS
jgi:hypothetical protein